MGNQCCHFEMKTDTLGVTQERSLTTQQRGLSLKGCKTNKTPQANYNCPFSEENSSEGTTTLPFTIVNVPTRYSGAGNVSIFKGGNSLSFSRSSKPMCCRMYREGRKAQKERKGRMKGKGHSIS